MSDTRYTIRSTTTHTEGGRRKTRTTSGTAVWLGADCGNLKPIVPKKR